MSSPELLASRRADELRRLAELALAAAARETPNPRELATLLHEFQVHQVELQMQNEELVETRAELEWATVRYRKLYDDAPVGYLRIDAHGTVLEANTMAAGMLALDPAALQGRKLASFMDRADGDRFHLHQQDLFTDGAAQSCEVYLRAADGRAKFVRIASARTDDDDGPECRCILVDLSEREVAAQALDDRQARFDAVVRTAADAVITFDQCGTIDSVNQATERIFGYTASELIGRSVHVLMPEPGNDAVADPNHSSNHDGSSIHACDSETIGAGRETVGLTRDGRSIPVRLSISKVGDDLSLGFAAFIHDLSDPKRLEQQALHAQKMEAVGSLASGVAHDFNNLLTGILGCAEQLLHDLPAGDSNTLHALEIRNAALSGASVVRQLMRFGHESDEDTCVVELDRVLHDAETMLRRLIGADIRFTVALGAPGARIAVGPGQIGQIVTNLVINACHAMANGGTLHLESAQVELSAKEVPAGLAPGAYLRFSLTDSGDGMDEATGARIFEPFFTTKVRGRGTGLGLSTVFAVIQQHHGHIGMRSGPGQGTTFTVLWPISLDTATAAAKPKPVTPGRGQTIVVVEDERLVAFAVGEYLRRGGYDPQIATDGLLALELVDAHHGALQLLLTDMVLPGQMMGPDVVAAVNKRSPKTRCLYMSAHSTEWLVREGRLPPGTESLQKPFSEAELLAAVGTALGATPAARTVA